MLLGCKPIDGSSSTYSSPVALLRRVRLSYTRCSSPVDSVREARPSER
jgi:hypothetical protein